MQVCLDGLHFRSLPILALELVMHGIAAKDGGLLLSTVRNLFVSSCFARAYLRQIHLLIIL